MAPALQRTAPQELRAALRPGHVCLLGFAVLVVLREEGPEVVGLLLVLDAGEYHLGARNLCSRILDVILERGLVPGQARILVGIGIGIVRRGAGLASVQSIQFRTDLVLGALTDRMTGQALVERGLAGGNILRQRGMRGHGRQRGHRYGRCEFFHGMLVLVWMFRGPRCRMSGPRSTSGAVIRSAAYPNARGRAC